jgi:protein-S-isoprenylcysteine O-methyltransferase Ste14
MTNSFFARGGWWVLGQSILMLAVIALALAFHGDWTRLDVVLSGCALFVLGAVFGIAGVVSLKSNRTPFPKPSEGSRLVQSGIYALVRHPLYTSVILASLGWSLVWQSRPALLAAVALVPFFHAKARCEERWLREKFPDYAGYEKRVKRFLPWVY